MKLDMTVFRNGAYKSMRHPFDNPMVVGSGHSVWSHPQEDETMVGQEGH